jgi:uncharacterized protein (DUF58 family)
VTVDRHLTAATAAPALVAAGFAALAALTGNAWFVLLAGAGAGLVVASLATRHRLGDLRLCLTGPTRIAVGETATFQLQVHNRGQVSSRPILVTDETRGLPVVRVHVGPIPPGGLVAVDLVRTATSRGVSDGSTLRMESTAPLGMLATQSRGDYARRLVVHPAPVPPDRSVAVRGPDMDSVHPVPGVGLDLAGIREWRTGDDPRRVHWRSTARRGRLIVAERGTGPAPALSVVVVGPSGAPDWEPLVAAAASTARTAQADGRPVAVTAWTTTGPSPVLAGTPVELLDWWAGLETVLLPAPQDLVASRGGHPTATALVIVASAQLPPAWWERVQRAAAGSGLVLNRLTGAPPASGQTGPSTPSAGRWPA